ncbi:hypothetical protein [Clostridium botulinum]|uniref:hypothetical protein n=1 Tax=Clostridium botulinum TaxID=1491 RepID=UPI001C9AADDE|nr:hypothetical protein [Clostridium botulinum]MBY6809002.1 hypothetical protein [Clostridium botulinum]MBY6822293.1 hypothetical protein [Clostridium botulinum]MBY6832917.1 hypothetical protein [Clostridium botulinum]MBY6972145.1 hypothetical protein [Clostridium botulinum]MCS6107949.1 hypothetical protein [Clostridium botulinum]
MNYGEVENKLKELDKVIDAFKEVIRLANMHGRGKECIDVPIYILNEEVKTLKSKIEHLKNNAIVNYDGDKYIDELLQISNKANNQVIIEGNV